MKRLRGWRLGIIGLLLASGCAPSGRGTPSGDAATPTGDATRIVFREVARESGIRYAWKLPDKPVGNILDLIGNGCAFLDYDNDGNLDILLVAAKLALYKGDGNGHFTEVTHEFGLDAIHGQFMGCATGDFNKDGFVDIYLTAYRGGALLKNAGGKRFEDVTKISGVALQPWGTSAAFGDLFGSGNLDLFIGDYVQFGPETQPQLCQQKDIKTACAPRQYPPEPSVLYRGDGKGHFTDVTKMSGFDKLSGKALGVAIANYDGSGRLSVAVANDEMPGDLMKNQGGGKFENIAKMAGVATDNEGNVHGGMGIDWGDVDGDGRLDLFVGTYQSEAKNVYHNDGNDLFADKSAALGLTDASPWVTFGSRLADFNNDGFLDLVMANGHVQDNIEKIDARTAFRQPTLFFQGKKGGSFVNITEMQDKSVTKPIVGRGLAIGDYDNDGLLDVLVVDSGGSPLLLHNETKGAGHFVGFSLSQPGGISPLGATLTVTAGGKTLVRHYHTDGSYMSASDARTLFGLGSATRIDNLRVAWPGGGRDTYSNLPIDRYLNITRGKMPSP